MFLNQKAKSLFHDRKRPAKIAWTVQFRKAHKKVTFVREYSENVQQPDGKTAPLSSLACILQDQEAQVARKKRRNTSRVQTRSIAGASVEVTGKPHS